MKLIVGQLIYYSNATKSKTLNHKKNMGAPLEFNSATMLFLLFSVYQWPQTDKGFLEADASA